MGAEHDEGTIDDLVASVREGRPLRPGARYRVEIGDQTLTFSQTIIDDPVVSGRQIIEVADARPVEEHLAFQLLRDGGLEELRLEETVDLRAGGVERFLIFRASESYRFELDGRVMEWGAPTIGEPVLRQLARIPDDYNVWQEQRREEDKLLERGAEVPLSPDGLERFYTGKDATTAGRSFLPEQDRRYLDEGDIAYEEVEEAGQKAIVLREYPLPSGGYDYATADVLILLPPTWPDTGTDMFYMFPWVKLGATGAYANAADQPHVFAGRTWQRWSRHNSEWRSGLDGMRTVLRRIDAALRNG